MSSTGRVGCHAARAGRLVAARAIALAAANAWAITGLILVTGVFLRAAPSGPARLRPFREPASNWLRSSWAQYIVCQAARATSAIFSAKLLPGCGRGGQMKAQDVMS